MEWRRNWGFSLQNCYWGHEPPKWSKFKGTLEQVCLREMLEVVPLVPVNIMECVLCYWKSFIGNTYTGRRTVNLAAKRFTKGKTLILRIHLESVYRKDGSERNLYLDSVYPLVANTLSTWLTLEDQGSTPTGGPFLLCPEEIGTFPDCKCSGPL